MEIANPHSIEHRTQFEFRLRAVGWTSRGEFRDPPAAFGQLHRRAVDVRCNPVVSFNSWRMLGRQRPCHPTRPMESITAAATITTIRKTSFIEPVSGQLAKEKREHIVADEYPDSRRNQIREFACRQRWTRKGRRLLFFAYFACSRGTLS